MESFQEAVIHTLRSITGHGINGNIVDAAEDAVFDIRVVAHQAAQQQAAALFARLNAAADPSAEFDALLKETDGGVLADEDWTDDLRDAASALEPGQISGLLETEEGVSILRRLPADSAAVKEAYFDQQLQDAAGHSEIQWTDACAALNSETFWNAVKRGGID